MTRGPHPIGNSEFQHVDDESRHSIITYCVLRARRGCLQPPSWTHHTLHFNILIYANCQGNAVCLSLSLGNRSLHMCNGVAHFDRFHFSFNCFPCQRSICHMSVHLPLFVCPSARFHNLLEVWPGREWTGWTEENLYLAFQFPAKYFDVQISISFSTKCNANKVV